MPSLSGLWDLWRGAEALTASPSSGPRRATRLASPWATADLERVVWSDVFGADVPTPVTRAEAMSVPAHARGRHLLVGTIGPAPLRAYKGDQLVDPQPSWLYRTDTGQSPQHRLAWTVDDLIHYGWSLWACQRGASSGDRPGPILDAVHVPYTDWDVDQDNRFSLSGIPVRDESVILFEGFHEGVLAFGSDTLRTAKSLERTVRDRAGSPAAVTELHDTGSDLGDLNRDEALQVVRDYSQARLDPLGAVTYTPSRIELKVHGESVGRFLIEGRNASAVDVARHLGIPASLIDATGPSASLKYETAQGRSLEFTDYSTVLYAAPIAARLSMDDVSPRGTRVAVDLTDLRTPTPAPSGPALED